MNVLVIGGTRFVGRHIVCKLLERGHQVTLFHRGNTGPELFPDLPSISGDRLTDLAKAADQKWDAVIDTCGYVPRVVKIACEALKNSTKCYLFISTISVLRDAPEDHLDEDAPMGTMPDESVEEINGETYGPLKALCEKVVLDAFGNNSLIVRPGLVAGRWDYTDRFSYWPITAMREDTIFAPLPKDHTLQFIDGRDLGAFCVKCLEDQTRGTFHATSHGHSWGDIIDVCVTAAAGDEPIVRWAEESELTKLGVAHWTDLPLWAPESTGGKISSSVDISRGLEAGLALRPLEETVKEIRTWFAETEGDRPLAAGLTPEKLRELVYKV